MATARKERMKGVVVSLPTFNDDKYEINYKRSKRHIEWLLSKGVVEGSAVMMIAGGLGECYFLDDDEWERMVDTLVEAANGKVPTMIGVFELSARRAAKKARYAASAGIDFLQIAPPHYMVPSEEDVYRHYAYVNEAADVGLMIYNIPWAMPKPGFELSQRLLERLSELRNVEAVKWASHDINHYLRVLRLFSDKLAFIDNMMVFSLGAWLGMKGFVDFQCNVAPKLSLYRYQLLKEKKFSEYADFYMKMFFDPMIKIVNPEEVSWAGMGEGPTSRLRLRVLGLESGPEFPAQAPLSKAYIDAYTKGINASGVKDWVEWKQSILDGI